LQKDQTINKLAQLIKGESSHWINENNLIDSSFYWQDDYWAVSVSESHLAAVRKYIHNQEKHHQIISFADEMNQFTKKYGWKLIEEKKTAKINRLKP